MYAAVMAAVASADVFIGVAAVADYRPTEVAKEKIKKSEEEMVIRLVKSPDIISSVSEHSPRPFIAGFAAETENVVANGQEKLERKGLDLLFANHATETFNSDNVTVTALTKDDQQVLGPGNKHTVARAMLSLIASQLQAISKGHAA
jgi:phosphopantothenoylcysteine decarboxylase/phosphopantothenate--cysteine ligase